MHKTKWLMMTLKILEICIPLVLLDSISWVTWMKYKGICSLLSTARWRKFLEIWLRYSGISHEHQQHLRTTTHCQPYNAFFRPTRLKKRRTDLLSHSYSTSYLQMLQHKFVNWSRWVNALTKPWKLIIFSVLNSKPQMKNNMLFRFLMETK